MALLLLLSTISFTVEKHFCGDELIDIAVFSDIEKCAKETFGTIQVHTEAAPCCKDTLVLFKGQKELTVKTIDDLDLDQQQLFTSYTFTFNSLFEMLKEQTVTYQYYYSPHLIVDIQVLNQEFLI